MYKCTACGKEFERGARIIGRNIYCPDCSEEIESIEREFEVAYMEAKLFKSVDDKYIERLKDALSRNDLTEAKVVVQEIEGALKAKPDINDYIAKNKSRIEKLKLPESWFKHRILRRCIEIERPRV